MCFHERKLFKIVYYECIDLYSYSSFTEICELRAVAIRVKNFQSSVSIYAEYCRREGATTTYKNIYLILEKLH